MVVLEISLLCGMERARQPARFPARYRSNFNWGSTVLRLGQQIRLTRNEVAAFTRITDIEPAGICTLDDLEAYVAKCKQHYWGVSEQTQFIHWLIDREYRQCHQAA